MHTTVFIVACDLSTLRFFLNGITIVTLIRIRRQWIYWVLVDLVLMAKDLVFSCLQYRHVFLCRLVGFNFVRCSEKLKE